jgi:hypothetical protein
LHLNLSKARREKRRKWRNGDKYLFKASKNRVVAWHQEYEQPCGQWNMDQAPLRNSSTVSGKSLAVKLKVP